MNDMIFVIATLLPVLGIVYLTFFIPKKLRLDFKSHWFLNGYFILLLIGLVVYLFLPQQQTSQAIKKEDIDELPMLWQYIEEGTLETKGKSFIRRTWEFPYDNPTIKINSIDNDYIDIPIDHGHSEKEGMIEITYYESPIKVDGFYYELNDHVTPIVELRQNELLIGGIERDVRFSRLQAELPFLQFQSQLGQDDERNSIGIGESLLYIKLPPKVNITEYDGEPVDSEL